MAALIRLIETLAPEELQVVLEHVRGLPFTPSTLANAADPQAASPARTSGSHLLEEAHPITQLLHARLNACVAAYARELAALHPAFDGPPLPGGQGVHSWREPLQVLRYRPGQRYVFHHDCDVNPASSAYHRVITAILYLNDSFSGGETEFVGELVRPRPGHAVVFPSNWCFPHSGREVRSGEKYVVVTWFHAALA